MNSSTEQLTSDMASDLAMISKRGWAACKLCGFRFYGDSFGEIFQALGEHGDAEHTITGKEEL